MPSSIYGPVPSRRLGVSLGVDLVPSKVCSFNCVYCECGRNAGLTTERKEYVPTDTVWQELKAFLDTHPAPDVVSFSGSGEPTLHSGLGILLERLRIEYPQVKRAVLTNSSLLDRKDVRSELLLADIVLPSLDAATEKAYIAIDRPHPSLKIANIIKSLSLFRDEYKTAVPQGQFLLEVFLIEGINTDPENIRALREAALLIRPDRIQLNALDRPGTEAWVKAPSISVMEKAAQDLDLPEVEIIAPYRHRSDIKGYSADLETVILDTVSRRPCTAQGLSSVLGVHIHEVHHYLDVLETEGKLERKIMDNEHGTFYRKKT